MTIQLGILQLIIGLCAIMVGGLICLFVINYNIKVDDRGIKNVNEDELLFAMVKAIQELSAKNNALETRVATLEAA